MAYDPQKHHRRSTRLQSWDYSWPWWYYVTFVVRNREAILGDVVHDAMRLSRIGEIVQDQWLAIPQRYKDTELDDFVVMPNHVHGIIIIGDDPAEMMQSQVGAIHESPLPDMNGDPQRKMEEEDFRNLRRKMTLSKILGWVKMNSAKRINILRATPGVKVWQRDFHDHIIRDDADLHRIRTYIANNPREWDPDEENPEEADVCPQT